MIGRLKADLSNNPGHGNHFTGDSCGKPPGSPSLAGSVTAYLFSAGANPHNLVYTSGIGNNNRQNQ